MISLALDAFIEQIKSVFSDKVGNRIYRNWPAQSVSEIYPYLVVFTNRTSIEYVQDQIVKQRDKNNPESFDIYSTGYFEALIDVNYLSKGGKEKDQSELIDRMSDFFNLNGSVSNPNTVISRDIHFKFHGYPATANAQFLEVLLDQQTGENIKDGIRRSIFSINLYIPRLRMIKQPHWTGYELEAHISEKPKENT